MEHRDQQHGDRNDGKRIGGSAVSDGADCRDRGGPADQQQQRAGLVGYAGIDEYPVGAVMKKARM